MKYLICLILFLFILTIQAVPVISAYDDTYVRVAIFKEAKTFDFSVDGYYQILDSNNKVIYQGNNLKTGVSLEAEGFYFNNLNLKQDKIIIKPARADAIKINDRRFRGEIWLINKTTGILAINYIGIEDYLKGVLYHEISHYWPMEAIKAQAIVSRTFAMYQASANKSKEFDLTADKYSQVYGGKTSERYRTTKAVEKTKGLVIRFKGNILPAYFHATCGGETEDASNLWDIDIAALKGVTCNYCKRSPHFRWGRSVSLSQISDALNKSGYNVNMIKDIIAQDRNKSGRISKLKIIDDEKTVEISAKDFRNIVGPNLIKSTNFQVRIDNNTADFQGLGWGHGVGMCQWGAYFLAKSGADYKDIIRYYYPGTVISRAD